MDQSTARFIRLVGTDKYVKEMEKQLAEEPIKISGFAVERSFSEKYLGVMIDARRSRETVISNMKYRVSECEEKLAKIRTLGQINIRTNKH